VLKVGEGSISDIYSGINKGLFVGFISCLGWFEI